MSELGIGGLLMSESGIPVMNAFNNQKGNYIIKMISSKNSCDFFLCKRFYDEKLQEWQYLTIKNVNNLTIAQINKYVNEI